MPIVSDGTPVLMQTGRYGIAAALIAGDLAGAKIDLFTNDINPTPVNIITDFDLPTWTGYAQKTVTGWTAVAESPLGTVRADATNVVTWAGPGDGTGQTVYGYLLRSSAGGNPVVYAYRFPVPVSVEELTDILSLVACLEL